MSAFTRQTPSKMTIVTEYRIQVIFMPLSNHWTNTGKNAITSHNNKHNQNWPTVLNWWRANGIVAEVFEIPSASRERVKCGKLVYGPTSPPHDCRIYTVRFSDSATAKFRSDTVWTNRLTNADGLPRTIGCSS